MSDGSPSSLNLEQGHSLWSDAWRRLKRNRLAVFSGILILVMALLGYGAPLIARHVTGFSLAEIHSDLTFQPPGTRDVSYDYPSFDGDPSSFEALDLDGDGRITCHREPAAQLSHRGLKFLETFAPTLYRQAREDLAVLDERFPVSLTSQVFIGTLRCPELDELNRLTRHFDFLFEDYDTVTGDASPAPGRLRPDGYITYREFPSVDGQLAPAHRDRGLAGPDAFRRLDVNGDNVIARWEVKERTRYMRWSTAKELLIGSYDLDHDLAITRDEYPGAPALRTFWLGTDSKGRDVLTRLFYGARISITIGLLATLVSLLIGVSWGATAGYWGGRVDNLMMRFVDVLYGLPYFFIVIVLMAIVERSTINLFIALGAVQWLSMSRVVRGQVISLKNREFVEAARAIGTGRTAIIFRHLVRNSIGPVIVYSTLMVPGVILQEAFLSFLGLGVQPPDPSWGNMITEGADKFQDYTWLILWPGLALASTLFAMNFFGDGVRDAIDPQAHKG
jgi:oligopeptide transport system permease protein